MCNAQSFIAKTIDSILNQTFEDFELLLLDDGSTDNYSELIKSYQDRRIKYFKRPHNFIETLNFGLDIAKGDYIALIDHDDIMIRERLKIQYNFMNGNQDIIACGGCINQFGMETGILTPPLQYEELLIEMSIRSPMYNPTGFIRTQAIRNNKIRYSEGYSFSADYKSWSDLIKVGKVVNILEVLTFYRVYNSQTSRVYVAPSSMGAMLIRQEIINYIFSCYNSDDETYEVLDNQLIPALFFLAEKALMSLNLYFQLNYNVIRNLHIKKKLHFPYTSI